MNVRLSVGTFNKKQQKISYQNLFFVVFYF